MTTAPITQDLTSSIEHQVGQALALIETLPPTKHASDKKPLEIRLLRYANWMLWISVSLFAILCIMAGIAHFRWLPKPLVIWAVLIGLLSQLFAFAALILQTSIGIWSMRHFRKGAADMRWFELTNDQASATALRRFTPHVLKELDFWLTQYSGRREREQAMFFGSPIALLPMCAALLGLPALFLAAFDNLLKLVPWAAKWLQNSWVVWLPATVLALVIGLVLGGFLVRRDLHRIAHQRELIALALRKDEREKDANS